MLCVNRFNSRTPCGVRLVREGTKERTLCFNSRTPCGVRLHVPNAGAPSNVFQFTHPVWGATEEWLGGGAVDGEVSIHAPRVGCDYLLQLINR